MALDSSMRSDRAVQHIGDGLSALLEPFGRTLADVKTHYAINRDCTEIHARVMMPWGDESRLFIEMPHTSIVQRNPAEVILQIIHDLFKLAIDEQDIKEEVAEGSLPPDVLDILENIHNVPNAMVI